MTETQTVITSIKDLALAAYHEEKARKERSDAAFKAETGEKAKKIFTEFFGVEPQSVDGTLCGYDDHQFRCYDEFDEYRRYTKVCLVVHCPKCGEEAVRRLYNLADYGEVLETGNPGYLLGHYCPVVKEAESDAELLLQTLRNVLNQER